MCVLCLRVAEFATLGDMKNAMTKLDGTELGGRKIRLSEDKSSSRHRRLMSLVLDNCAVRVSIPAPFSFPEIWELQKLIPGNGLTHGLVVVMLSHGGGCWSVRHATCCD